MTRIILAPGLRPLCDNHAVVETDAGSVDGLVSDLTARFPALSSLAGADRSNWAIELFLNGATIEKGANPALSPDDEVVVFHPIAGG